MAEFRCSKRVARVCQHQLSFLFLHSRLSNQAKLGKTVSARQDTNAPARGLSVTMMIHLCLYVCRYVRPIRVQLEKGRLWRLQIQWKLSPLYLKLTEPFLELAEVVSCRLFSQIWNKLPALCDRQRIWTLWATV